uniref:Uncharacterized protein n=1 Tax=Oryza barthii TaxID=65489 RepID=A0A0D3GRV1_9ORYZ
MASSSDVDLADSGPVHMMAKNDCTGSSGIVIDWDKEEHRHCLAACLVKGVMVMMKDRSNPLAPAWWKSFGFRCRNVDTSDQGSSDSGRDDEIFGATYEYEPPAGLPRHPSAPSYVVAF